MTVMVLLTRPSAELAHLPPSLTLSLSLSVYFHLFIPIQCQVLQEEIGFFNLLLLKDGLGEN